MLILVILLFLVFYYFLNGHFKTQFENSINPAENGTVYLGYGVTWNRALEPTIKDIKFTNSGGKVIQELENEKDTLIFIDNGSKIGSAKEEEVDPKLLTSFKNYKLKDQNLNLVFRVDSSNERLREVGGIKIEYSILGVQRSTILKIKFFK